MTSLRELLTSVGFHGKGLDTAVAVAMAESGGHPTSHNTNAGTGDNSYGLFQINMLGSLGPDRLREYHLSSNNQLFDPLTNARVAYKMSDGGTNWTPWSTYKRGDYLKYIGKDMQIDGAVPDPNAGVSDDPSAGLDPSSNSDGFDISGGQSLTALHANQAQLRSQLDYVVGRGPLPHVPVAHTAAAHSVLPNGDAVDTFLRAAQGEIGESYVFGAKAGENVAHPTALDCSGLTKWAAERAGAELPDGAAHQYLAMKKAGMLIPVDQAMHTPGALLFHFAAEPQPGQGEPEIAHVAISKGNGMTLEAADEQDGIVSWKAAGRFNYAAVIPGIGTTDPSETVHSPLSTSMHATDGSGGLGDDGSTDDPFGHSLSGAHAGGLGHGLGTTDTMQEGIDFDEHYGGWDLGHH